MAIRRAISRCLNLFEGGRALRAHLRAAVCENPIRELPQAAQERGPWPLTHLDRMDVEASFFCNLECPMCSRLHQGQEEGLMPYARFARLAPYFRYIGVIVLTGWGEPLVHPQLPEFVSLVRAHGSKPRLATNATLLNEDRAARLIDAGLDIVHISIDAGTKATYDRVRLGAKWERVLHNCGAFCRMRDARNAQLGTAWAYVLMRENFRELPLAAELASELGFHKLFTNFIAQDLMEYEHKQVLHARDGKLLVDEHEFEDVIAKTREIAERNHLQFDMLPFHAGFGGGCLANPLHSLFVDWVGNVTPCCNLPVRNELRGSPPFCFGNIDEQDLMEILLTDRLQAYVCNWRERRIPEFCRRCYQSVRMPDRANYSPCPE